tara:strand:- start:173 stop:1213 length:1041 start_codon:yes stop_codon:yes gene_type:complete
VQTPRVEIDLNKIRLNSEYLVKKLKPNGIRVVGVTKAVCGHPEIASAIIAGGVNGLADARIENVVRMRRAGINSEITMIRTPMASQIELILDNCNASFNTEISIIEKLANAAQKKYKTHNIILMVEMGDLREGILPKDLERIVKKVANIPGIALKGIGANFACLNKVPPDKNTMLFFSNLVNNIKSKCRQELKIISAGNSASLPWALSDSNSKKISELRLGEAILLGIDPISGDPIEGLYTDSFTLKAEVIELSEKSTSKNVFNYQSIATSLYKKKRVILAIGKQDTDVNGLTYSRNTSFLGATSDHLVLKTSDPALQVGSELKIKLNYSALVRVMNNPTIEKITL